MAPAALRFARLFLVLSLLSSSLCFCACRKAATPEALFERVRQEAQRGELDAALRDVRQAFRDYSRKDSRWAWRFRVLNAHILVLRGSDSEALDLLKEKIPDALATSETAIRQKFVSGIAHESLQQLDTAQQDLDEAERLARLYQPALLADVEQSRGQLEMDRANFAAAEEDFHAALAAAREQKQPFLEVTALGALGNAAMAQDYFDRAIDKYREALKLAESIGMQSSIARVRGSMGWSSFELGDFERARSLYQQGVDLSQKSGLVADQVYWLTGLAESQFALEDYAAAEATLQEALGLAETQDDKRILAQCLNDLAVVMLGTGRLEMAEKYNQRALDTERRGVDQSEVLDTKMLNARIKLSRHEFAAAEQQFQEIVAEPKSGQASRWEAQAHLATMYEEENLASKAEEQFDHALHTIQKIRASIQEEEFRLSFLSSSISFYGDYVDFLISRGRSNEALRIAEESRAPTLEEGLRAAGKNVRLPTTELQPQAIAKRIGATLLFYWLGQHHSYLWVFTPDKTVCLNLPASTEIDPLVKRYRELVAGSADVAESERVLGEKLYAILVSPAQKFIRPQSRVVLLPDGSLYTLNFETLIVPGPNPHFWIEDATISTASSLSLLASADGRKTLRRKSLLLVGDALKASDEFEPLTDADREMGIVQSYFPAAERKVLRREHATPRGYLDSDLEQYGYLHFVTHGTASRTWPLESAVILSKESTSDSYKLYARDIVTRHLNAELVTISACNGAGTRAYAGEGLVGLSWAFLRAGAHHVIGALWEVSDAPSTSDFMNVFYRELSRGQDVGTALRGAKLSFLHSSNTRSVFRKPYYWAPFQLYVGS